MRFTALGKFLFFLLGLALIATAVHLYVPADQRPWNRHRGDRTDAPRPDNNTRDQIAKQNAPPEPAAREERPAADSADPWVRIPAGLFRSGRGATQVDLPAFSMQRREVTNAQYASFLEACPRGSACGPRELPSYWEDRAYLVAGAQLPVVFVSWNDAAAYCLWAGARLLTAAEWGEGGARHRRATVPGGRSPRPGRGEHPRYRPSRREALGREADRHLEGRRPALRPRQRTLRRPRNGGKRQRVDLVREPRRTGSAARRRRLVGLVGPFRRPCRPPSPQGPDRPQLEPRVPLREVALMQR
ncbi:MAG: SUMF1/EgtB/PvdO family nonheme iron enzyme [Thermoanaerobaculia bacterium]